jgi:hypothetical protein
MVSSSSNWTILFLTHGILELVLGCLKLKGYYSFEKRDVLHDLKDIAEKNEKNRSYVEQRVKLMQYTRYHALSRMSLALIAFAAVAMNGVDGRSKSTGGLLPLGLGFCFWHGSASLVVIVHLLTYPDHAKISGAFFIHVLLTFGFAAFCIFGPGGKRQDL